MNDQAKAYSAEVLGKMLEENRKYYILVMICLSIMLVGTAYSTYLAKTVKDNVRFNQSIMERNQELDNYHQTILLENQELIKLVQELHKKK